MQQPNSRSVACDVTRVTGTVAKQERDQLALEEPLEIRINGDPLAVTMRTPGHDDDLAAGFCLTEGVAGSADDIEAVAPCREAEHGNVILVTLTDEALAARSRCIADARRESFLSSSCGVCGKQSIDRIFQKIGPLAGDFTVDRAVIAGLPDVMRKAQPTFDQTGGLHAAAIFDAVGKLLVVREDVGRHNAVDKAIGYLLLNGKLMGEPRLLLVSGRCSFEVVQKAAMAGIALVAGVSAPSSLARDFADRAGQTLIGFLRADRMNIYTHDHRVRMG